LVTSLTSTRVILRRSNLPIAFGVRAQCPKTSRERIKKLCISDKGIVKSSGNETIARIGNSDKVN
jgi:hypothetical protein